MPTPERCRRVGSRVLFSGTVFVHFRGRGGSQPSRNRTRPEREARLIRASLAGFLGAMVLVGSAAAAHCPPGQFYRVRLKLCVGTNTSLALAYVHVAPSRPPGAEPEAIPGGKSESVAPFVLPKLDDWPASK